MTKDTSRERELADHCDLTVITESSPFIHGNGLIKDASRRIFGREAERYDLLSVPSLKHLLKQQEWLETLALDVKTALSLHKAEKVLVATISVPPRALIQRLKEVLGAQCPKIRGFTLQRPRWLGPMPTLAVTCMDYRLRGPEGLAPKIAGLIGSDAFGILSTAGAAKELAADSPRSRMVMAQLDLVARDLKRLVLCSHTDCGKYDARHAFGSDAALERSTLVADLAAARERLSARFPKLRVDAMIARTKGERCTGVAFCDD